MVKLPDFRDAGQPGSYRSGRGIVSANELNAGAVGRGVANVGQTVVKISDEEHKKQSAMGLLEADIHKAKYGTDFERTFDDDPDYKSYDMRFKTGVAPINEDAASKIPDPELRKKWLQQQQLKDIAVNDRLQIKAGSLGKAEDLAKVDSLLGEGANAYIAEKDDTIRMQRLAENEARIAFAEKQGLITPAEANAAREKHVTTAKQRRLQMMLDEDPESVIPKVAGTRIAKPYKVGEDGSFVGEDGAPVKNVAAAAKGGASDTGLEFIRQRESYKERAYPDGRQYSVGFGTKAKSPNEVITREEAERRLVAETNKVAKWVDSNVSVPLAKSQKDALISFGYNLGTDDLEKLKDDINAGSFEKVAQRMLSFDRANLDGQGLKQLDGLSRRRQMEAQLFMGEVPDAEFADLDPDFRSKVAKEAMRAKNVRLESRLWDFNRQIDDDVESIRRSGVGRDNIELEAIKKTVEPSVWNKYVNNRREAELEFDAGRDLATMRTDDLPVHLDNLVPDPGASDYAMRQSVYDKTKVKADKIREIREKDPAASVNDLPEVKAAAADYKLAEQEGGADFGKIIQARLAAQERVGIPSYDQSPITRAEAAALLDLPQNRAGISEKEYRNRLRAAADRAEEQYGPIMARQAFESAIRFHVKDTTGSDAAAGIISKMVKGEAVTRDDYSRMTELQNIDQIGRTFSGIFRPDTPRPDMGDEDRPYVSPNFAREANSFVTQYAAEQAASEPDADQQKFSRDRARLQSRANGVFPEPNTTQKQWLTDNPDAWRDFEVKFGPGSAAKALGKTSKGTK